MQIKFYIKIFEKEEIHLIFENHYFYELYEKIHANHPNKGEYWIIIMQNVIEDNKPIVIKEKDDFDSSVYFGSITITS